MSTSAAQFSLRAMQPSDSAAVAALMTEFDADMTTRFLIDPYTAITAGTENATEAVVVEANGYDGLVGMGTVRFSQVQFNGNILPMAFLDGLKVRTDFRRRGLGYRIAEWRVQRARELFGDDCVIATAMLQENTASRQVAAKWCREFIDPAVEVLIAPVRSTAPKPPGGVRVCEIEPGQSAEFASGQNDFHRSHNLYPPGDAGLIAHAHVVSAEGRKPYRSFAVMDSRANLLAGAHTWGRGMLKSDTINHPPASLRLLNRAFRLLPPDFILRDIWVYGLWFAPGRIDLAAYLWEWLRWTLKDQGTTLAAAHDRGDTRRQAIALKPWHQPRPKITFAIRGPEAIDREKPLYGIGRV